MRSQPCSSQFLGWRGVAQALASVSLARDDAFMARSDWRLIDQRHKALRTPSFVDAAARAARAARHASMGGDTVHIARARMQAEVEALAAAAGLEAFEVILEPRPDRSENNAALAGVEPIRFVLMENSTPGLSWASFRRSRRLSIALSLCPWM